MYDSAKEARRRRQTTCDTFHSFIAEDQKGPLLDDKFIAFFDKLVLMIQDAFFISYFRASFLHLQVFPLHLIEPSGGFRHRGTYAADAEGVCRLSGFHLVRHGGPSWRISDHENTATRRPDQSWRGRVIAGAD